MRIFFIALLFLSSCSDYNKINEKRINMIKDYSFCSCIEYSLGMDLTNDIREVDFSRALLFDISEDVSLCFLELTVWQNWNHLKLNLHKSKIIITESL